MLLKKAILALYAAKGEGAGKYRFFEPEMEAGAQRRRALEIGLRSAIENREIELVFQPVVELDSGAWPLRGAGAPEIGSVGLRVAGGVYSGRRIDRTDRADRRIRAARGG